MRGFSPVPPSSDTGTLARLRRAIATLASHTLALPMLALPMLALPMLALPMLAALFSVGLAEANAACVVTERAEVPLDIRSPESPGPILAPVLLNNRPAHFVVDTGAQRSVVSPATVQAFGLALDEWVGTTMSGIGGVNRRRNANPTSFSLGGIALHRRTVGRDASLTVADLPSSPPGPRHIDGLLGRDFLSAFDIVLDLPNRRLTLYDVSGCAGRFLPWPGDYQSIPVESPAEAALVVRVALDGRPLRALLDSGASVSLLAAPGIARMGVTPRLTSQDETRRISGVGPHTVTAYRHRFQTLKIGEDETNSPLLWTAPISLIPISDMLLGADWLAGRMTWISYATRQVFVTR